ncbi:MAG: hypothetical protein QFX35_02170 [Candidatus Verstraetearchaeota archaeon]|nr:hypothetical protein [Candidatus Verstraetearchaeota archaeon]
MNTKVFSVSIVALLLLPAIFAAFPLVSATITNRPHVFIVDEEGNLIDGDPLTVDAGGNICISLEGMTITGAQVWLWLSRSGSADANQGDGDRWYAGPFYMGDVISESSTPYTFTPNDTNPDRRVPYPFNLEGRNYSYTVGNYWINGTIPMMVLGGVTYWLKITDVDPRTTSSIPSSDVGVSTNRINFSSILSMSPHEGAPGTPITIYGSTVSEGVYSVYMNGQYVTSVSAQLNNEGGWEWTGFSVEFPAIDLGNKYTCGEIFEYPMSEDIEVTLVDGSDNTVFTDYFTEYYREVWIDSDAFPCYEAVEPNEMLLVFDGCYYGCEEGCGIVFYSGEQYNVSLNWFYSGGSADIYIGSLLVASGIPLDGNGAVENYVITIPDDIKSDTYNFTVVDSNGVEYSFEVCVLQTKNVAIEFDDDTGSCGDEVNLWFYNMYDYIGEQLTVWFYASECDAPVLLWNGTVNEVNFYIPVTVPSSAGGERLVAVYDMYGNDLIAPDGSTVYIYTTFNVIPKVWVEPSSFGNDGLTFWVKGCGFEYDWPYHVAVDNQHVAVGYVYEGFVLANCSGDVAIQFVKAGFRPGVHTVAFYKVEGDGNMGNYPIAAYAIFTVTTTGDLIVGDIEDYMDYKFSELNASIVAIYESASSDIAEKYAIIQTDLGLIQANLSALDAKIVALQDNVAIIQTDLGLIQANLSALDAKVVDLQGSVATVQTSLGTLQGNVTSISGNVATIKTDVGTIKADLSSVKSDVTSVKDSVSKYLPVDLTPVWIAVVLALIAAIASIYAIVVIRSKIAA